MNHLLFRATVLTVLISLVFAGHSFAQNKTVRVKGQFFYKGIPFKERIGGRLGDLDFSSNSDGSFNTVAELSDSIGFVKMTLNKNYVIYTPIQGLVEVKDKEVLLVEVLIGKKNDSNNPNKIIIEKLEKILSRQAAPDKIKEDVGSLLADQTETINQNIIEYIQRIIDEKQSFQKLIDEMKLIEARKRDEKKIETLKLLTERLDDYVSRAEDLCIAFKSKGRRVFHNEKTVRYLNEVLKIYNNAYNELNKSKEKLIIEASYCFEDPPIVERDFRDLLDYALKETHRQVPLRFNNIIEDINCYNTCTKRKDRRKKKEILADIRRFISDLNERLITLKEKKTMLYTRYGS